SAGLRTNLAERLDRLAVAVCLGEGLRPCEPRLDPRPHVGRHAVLEILVVDNEPRGEPRDRVGRRPCLAALDLAHVLLRETLARELGLGQPGRDSEGAHALADAARTPRGSWPGSGGRVAHSAVTQAATSPTALPRWGETTCPAPQCIV